MRIVLMRMTGLYLKNKWREKGESVMAEKLELLVIDPQNDFCDAKGSLFVPGADKDSVRLAAMINRLSGRLDDIHVTLDTHHFVDIAHPIFWKDANGKAPDPFTLISASDVKNGVYRTKNPSWNKRALDYVETLAANGRYPLVIWPPHCLIGSWGHNVVNGVSEALLDWEKQFAMIDYVTKGSNPWTEHYSAIMADVVDPSDPTTALNTTLIGTLQNADIVLITGQALSHCVANTVRDIANNFGEDNIKKLILIEDTTSSVPSFENMADDFVKEMTARGMKVAKSDEVFA